jgi:hypothetical protein
VITSVIFSIVVLSIVIVIGTVAFTIGWGAVAGLMSLARDLRDRWSSHPEVRAQEEPTAELSQSSADDLWRRMQGMPRRARRGSHGSGRFS